MSTIARLRRIRTHCRLLPAVYHSVFRWLTVYGILTAVVITIALSRSGLFFWAAMRASTRIHNSMLLSVLRAPLAFFHTNPVGRILNRFSNDQVRCLARVSDAAIPWVGRPFRIFGQACPASYSQRCQSSQNLAANQHLYIQPQVPQLL